MPKHQQTAAASNRIDDIENQLIDEIPADETMTNMHDMTVKSMASFIEEPKMNSTILTYKSSVSQSARASTLTKPTTASAAKAPKAIGRRII